MQSNHFFNKKYVFIFLFISCTLLVPFKAFCSFYTPYQNAYDETKIDWWTVRSKNHESPRFNQDLSFKREDYDGYCQGDTSRPVLYLTFDEGYEYGYTEPILDVLKANNVQAIFFVTSPYITSNPELIKRMADEGHLVGNHSKNHPSMPKLVCSPDKFEAEIRDVEDKYREVTGQEMTKFFRPPMGHYSEKSLALTQSLGYKTLFWSFAYMDFDIKAQPSHEKAKKIILDNLHNGSILLLHAVSKTNTEILDDIIKEAKAMGYTFELIQS